MTDKIYQYKNSLPSEESCNRTLARMQWQMIADEYNEGECDNGWFVRADGDKIEFDIEYRKSESTHFKSKELIEEAYQNNKEIVERMLNIKK